MVQNRTSTTKFIWLAIASLLISILLFVLLIKLKSGNNIDNITSERFYYLILFPLAFSSAFCFFGILKSVAKYNGKQFGGTLQLGGPILIFIMVVVGGFRLVPGLTPFDFTFFFKDQSNRSINLKGYKVKLFLGNESKKEDINEDGFVDFKNIPEKFRDQIVEIEINGNDWLFSNNKNSIAAKLTDKAMTFNLRRPESFAKVFGRVNESGKDSKFLKDVEIQIASLSTRTDSVGRFLIQIPTELQASEYKIIAIKNGYKRWDYTMPTNATEIPIALIKE